MVLGANRRVSVAMTPLAEGVCAEVGSDRFITRRVSDYATCRASIVVIIALILLRASITGSSITAGRKGVNAKIKAHQPTAEESNNPADLTRATSGVIMEDSMAGGNIRADASGGATTVRRVEGHQLHHEVIGNILPLVPSCNGNSSVSRWVVECCRQVLRST